MDLIKQIITLTALGGVVLRHSVKIKRQKNAIESLEDISKKYIQVLGNNKNLTELTTIQLINNIIDIRQLEVQLDILNLLEKGGMYLVKGSITDIMELIIKSRLKEKNFDMYEEKELLMSKISEKARKTEIEDKISGIIEFILVLSISVNLFIN